MFWLILFSSVFVFGLAILAKTFASKTAKLDGRHVVITGGSSGIGKSMAIQAAQMGASVTIMARNKEKLDEARTEIQGHLKANMKVETISVDLSTSYDAVKSAMQQAEGKCGPVFMLVNSAGSSVSEAFVDLKPADFPKMMEMNYYSAVYATKAVVDSMVGQQAGRIVFLSSQAGQIGLFGFTAYSGAKFALRGMAEALQMELRPHNIFVTVSFPPDTDTPGFQKELQAGKPKETVLISETAGLFKADEVARTILTDSLHGKFMSYVGLDGWMLASITAGMSQASSLVEVITQVLLMGILRLVGLFYLSSFDKIVLRCKQEKDAGKQKSS
ncbi:3-ketodihydrosphingosine reductase-like [Mya arenaria]|uniref:3-ketodihydrosphingosine reductase-like n=1 Tax=Mya arenaria TaxID=6604 RepID=UPI0022DF1D19|nr:3-ketodihydrosphingosine reductase-like [Mya arenaria]